MIIIIIIKERSNTTWKGPHFFFRRPEWPRKCGICQAPEHKRHSTVGRKTRRSEAGGRLPLAPTPRLLSGFQSPLLPPRSQRPVPGCARPWLLRGLDHLWSRGERGHQWPGGGQRSPVAQRPRAAVREAWRRPHARWPLAASCAVAGLCASRVRTIDPWCHWPGPRPCTTPRVASPSTGAAGLREPESKGTLNPTPSHPRTAPRSPVVPPCLPLRRLPGLGACPTADTYPRE